MSLALVQQEQSQPVRLEELSVRANTEHRAAIASMQDGVRHAIEAGKALNEAHDLVPSRTWKHWLVENCEAGPTQAGRYMRIARYSELVVAEGITKVREAEQLVSALMANDREERIARTQRRRDLARKMHKRGVSKSEIARTFDVAFPTVTYWLAPASTRREIARAKTRQRRAGIAALKRQARDEAIKARGGDIARAYTLVRQLTATLDTAIASEGDSHARKALREALARAYSTEDAIVTATGTTIGGRSGVPRGVSNTGREPSDG